MKSTTKDQTARTLVVNPAARRCGVDDQPEDTITPLETMVGQVKGTEEFLAVSDRILNFANLADQEIEKLTQSCAKNDGEGLEKAAQRIASLASEVGAPNLIRGCYQLLIAVRQGDLTAAYKVAPSVVDEYRKFKSTLRLA